MHWEMMMRWPDAMGFEDPRHIGRVIAQVVLEQLGVPAGGRPAAAVGVVAVGQADGRAVAGDVPGMAFNAQAVTVAAQIAAAEASGRSAGGTGVSVAGRTPALRSAGRAAAGGTDFDDLAGGMPGGHDARPAPAVQGWRPSGGGRGPDPDGPAGKGWRQSRRPVNRQRNGRVERLISVLMFGRVTDHSRLGDDVGGQVVQAQLYPQRVGLNGLVPRLIELHHARGRFEQAGPVWRGIRASRALIPS